LSVAFAILVVTRVVDFVEEYRCEFCQLPFYIPIGVENEWIGCPYCCTLDTEYIRDWGLREVKR
jgi:hypothetical protein